MKVPALQLGLQSVALLGDGEAFRRQGLVKKSVWGCPQAGYQTPSPSHSSLFTAQLGSDSSSHCGFLLQLKRTFSPFQLIFLGCFIRVAENWQTPLAFTPLLQLFMFSFYKQVILVLNLLYQLWPWVTFSWFILASFLNSKESGYMLPRIFIQPGVFFLPNVSSFKKCFLCEFFISLILYFSVQNSLHTLEVDIWTSSFTLSSTLLSFIRNQISVNVSQFLKYPLYISYLFFIQHQTGRFIQLYNLFMGSSVISFPPALHVQVSLLLPSRATAPQESRDPHWPPQELFSVAIECPKPALMFQQGLKDYLVQRPFREILSAISLTGLWRGWLYEHLACSQSF